MTIVEQIKAEIESRIRSIENCPFIEAELGASEKRDGKLIAYKDLLSFISTLESEKPMNQNEDLNDEIKRFVAEYGYERGNDILLIAIVARHFAQWQKEQMMKEAVEADVFGENYGSHRKVISEWLEPEIWNPGDKVRIIIVKED